MGQAATRTRENRTITVDFQNEATYFQLLGDGRAFVEGSCWIPGRGFEEGVNSSSHMSYGQNIQTYCSPTSYASTMMRASA
jgi:hypothetical protein